MKNRMYLFLWVLILSIGVIAPLQALPNKAVPNEIHAPAQKKMSKKEKKSIKKRLKQMRSKLRKGKRLSKAEKIGMYTIFAGLGLLTTGAIMYFANVTGTGTILLLVGFILGFVGGIVWFLGSLFRRKSARKDKKNKRKNKS